MTSVVAVRIISWEGGAGAVEIFGDTNTLGGVGETSLGCRENNLTFSANVFTGGGGAVYVGGGGIFRGGFVMICNDIEEPDSKFDALGGTWTGRTTLSTSGRGGGGGKSVSSGLPSNTGGGGGGQDDSGDVTCCTDTIDEASAVCLEGVRGGFGEMYTNEMEGLFVVVCVLVVCSSVMPGSLCVSLSNAFTNIPFNTSLNRSFPFSFTSTFVCVSLSRMFVLFSTFSDPS